MYIIHVLYVHARDLDTHALYNNTILDMSCSHYEYIYLEICVFDVDEAILHNTYYTFAAAGDLII